ncbi:MAG TPA: hypothetical protein VG010_07725 [Solirubrobacteraceae bacterium]|nr:hypothetical protein [Solirubrobacteraceae bacterium]
MATDGPAPDRHLEVIRAVFEIVAREAGAADPPETAHQLQILLSGGLVASVIDERTPERVREMAEVLLQRSR